MKTKKTTMTMTMEVYTSRCLDRFRETQAHSRRPCFCFVLLLDAPRRLRRGPFLFRFVSPNCPVCQNRF